MINRIIFASNHGNNEESKHDIDLSRMSEHNFELNTEITEEEVLKCLSKLTSNHGNNEESNHNIDLSGVSEHNFELNSEITEEEVLKCLSKLKINNACSSDMILNEFL